MSLIENGPSGTFRPGGRKDYAMSPFPREKGGPAQIFHAPAEAKNAAFAKDRPDAMRG